MKNYKGYFQKIIYPAFIEYIMDGIGLEKFNRISKGQLLFSTKSGINPKIRLLFNKFLELNPVYLNIMSENGFKVFTPKNIAGGPLMPPINTQNHYMMIKEGIHPPYFELDTNQFVKNKIEKEKVQVLKRRHKEPMPKSAFKSKKFEPKGRLIIHLINVDKNKYFKTTYNYVCKETEIPTILSTFHEKDKVKFVKFNGKQL